MKRIPKEQSRIDNPKKTTIYGTQDEENTTMRKKNHNIIRHTPCHKIRGMNSGPPEGCFRFLITNCSLSY